MRIRPPGSKYASVSKIHLSAGLKISACRLMTLCLYNIRLKWYNQIIPV